MRSNLPDFTDVFTSKGNVLDFLKTRLKKSKIEKIYLFSVSDWKSNPASTLKQIFNNFNTNSVIVRSSAVGEDSITNSQAGNYDSVLNVPSSSKLKLKNAINTVIESYAKNKNSNPQNQILVQTQTQNILSSGVIFTRTSNGSPYYVVNYSDGDSTDNVTKGEINNVIKFFAKINPDKLPKKWQILLESIREIESIFQDLPLDIEFGITKSHKVVIFQVRPITFAQNTIQVQEKLEKIVKSNQNKLQKLSIPLKKFGDYTFYSDMADWNPSEIIGDNPHLLDYSLYDELILKKMWREGRRVIGYQDTSPLGLMKKFGNKPYIDIRASFNSMIPAGLNINLRKKLLKYYFQKLSKNHELHDKVEFEILFSCYDLSTGNRLKSLKKEGFSATEILEIQTRLLDLTNNIISDFNKIFEDSLKNIKTLETQRKFVLSKQTTNYKNLLYTAKVLLDDCRELGVLPFSTMARIAFVANIILKSLIHENVIEFETYYQILNSVKTPIKELQIDLQKTRNKKLSKNQFFKKYGHLRPGTYDITAKRYDETKEMLENFNFKENVVSEINSHDKIKIQNILQKNGLIFNDVDFFAFVSKSLSQREYLKFEFTKNLSDSIELIAKAGNQLGFSREDMSYLDINTIFSTYTNYGTKELKELWRKKISNQKKEFELNSYLNLPPIIDSVNDFEIVQYYVSKPNFISTQRITGDLVFLKKNSSFSNIKGKIVVIENADPGYDWIFAKKPLGLITKYGGVASHMAIRCSEIGLPAAIGCGDITYEKLLSASRLLMDCQNQQLIILETEKHDEFTEEKKILKSLGYIK